MRILIVGDPHGKPPEIEFSGFDLVLATGDFCSVSSREYRFKVIKARMKDPSYPKNWYDLTGKERAIRMIKQDLKSGRKVLEKLDSLGVPVLAVPGNTDYFSKQSGLAFEARNHYQDLLKGLKNVQDCHLKLKTIGELHIIGFGTRDGAPEYPQHKERLSPEKLKRKKQEYQKALSNLDALFSRATKPVLFLSHNVPFGTRLDIIKMPGSPRHGWHYGSVVAKEMIEKHQPLVLVGGHMHECTGTERIGRTLCINVGSGTALLEVSPKGVVSLDFHQEPPLQILTHLINPSPNNST